MKIEKIERTNALRYFILYKPFRVLCQFSASGEKKTLKSLFDFPIDVYPVGRLDEDSEGLLILTNDASLNEKILHPKHAHSRTYLVQVDGKITDEGIEKLQQGFAIKVKGEKHIVKKSFAKIISETPKVPERNPPIRFRKNIPTSWIELELTEGKNHQVRKMTAAVGFPTLRLIRWRIENLSAEKMKSGEVIEMKREELFSLLNFNRESDE